MFFNMIAQPDMHQAMQAEIDAEGENIRSWIFEPLEAVSEDWRLAEALDQAIDEGNSILDRGSYRSL
ncbi:MAG: hypothetical protein GY792_37690 [Gammaproteobacteria bacterium]|nr:hypothetical protein [Gammaproteobacteria bacterium]